MVCLRSSLKSYVPIGHSVLPTAVPLVKVAHGRLLIGWQWIRYLSVTIWLATGVSGISGVLAIRGGDMPAFVATGLCLLSLWQHRDGRSHGRPPATLVVLRTTLWPLQSFPPLSIHLRSGRPCARNPYTYVAPCYRRLSHTQTAYNTL